MIGHKESSPPLGWVMGKEEGRVMKGKQWGIQQRALTWRNCVDRSTGNIQRYAPQSPCIQATTPSTRKTNGSWVRAHRWPRLHSMRVSTLYPQSWGAMLVIVPSDIWRGSFINSSLHTAHQPSRRTAAHVPQTWSVSDCSITWLLQGTTH